MPGGKTPALLKHERDARLRPGDVLQDISLMWRETRRSFRTLFPATQSGFLPRFYSYWVSINSPKRSITALRLSFNVCVSIPLSSVKSSATNTNFFGIS